MSTHQVSIIEWPLVLDASGLVFLEPYSVKATNDVWNSYVVVFNNTATRSGFSGRFRMPSNYVGSPKIIPVWTSTVTTGNAVWDFEYRAIGGDDAESLDQTGTQESVTVTDAAPTAANNKLEASMTLTAGNLLANDVVEFNFYRDKTDSADTLSGAILLFDLVLEWADA